MLTLLDIFPNFNQVELDTFTPMNYVYLRRWWPNWMLDILLDKQRELLHQILKEATNGNPQTQISSVKGVQGTHKTNHYK